MEFNENSGGRQTHMTKNSANQKLKSHIFSSKKQIDFRLQLSLINVDYFRGN